MADEFSSFFENALKSLNIKPSNIILGNTNNLSDPVEITVKQFENHPSVQTTQENIGLGVKFDFEQAEVDVSKEIKNLHNNKNGTIKNVHSNHLKEVPEISAPCLANIWNPQILSHHIFTDNLKLADIFKKEDSDLAKSLQSSQ